MKAFLRLLPVCVLLLGSAVPEAAEAAPKAVVELFTSQGCASCPPADALLAELAERDDVIALSLHVDYWNYLGWKDTFGRAENSDRQRAYAQLRGDRRIYTPQLVVNGGTTVVGHDRAAVGKALAEATLAVPVEVRLDPDRTIAIRIGASPRPGALRTTIRLIAFAGEAAVRIEAGENAGRTIEYYNVVRAMRAIGMWKGDAMLITLPAAEVLTDGADGCVVLVQEDLADGPGAILGAAMLGHWR